MARVDTVTLTDGTNRTYEYEVWTPDTDWNDIGTVYGFLKQLPNNQYNILYIGKAASMCNRQDSHEKWDVAKRNGATHIMARVVKTEAERQSEEKALIAHYKPVLNVQHVNSGQAQQSGRV